MVSNLRITGMTCNGCVGHVSKALKSVRGVSAVEVSLPDRAKIVHDDAVPLPDMLVALAAAVDGAGYAATPV